MSHKEYDILIGYSRADTSLAEELARRLQASETRVWLDKWNVPPGQNFVDAFNAGLSNSDAVGICIGPDISQNLPLDLFIKSSKQNSTQIILPILVRGAKPENFSAELRKLLLRERAEPNADKLVYKLARTLFSMGEGPAARYLLQASSDKPAGLLDDLMRLFGNPHKEGTVTPLAKQILRGQSASPLELLALATKLKVERQFGYARRILARARMSPTINEDARLRRKVYQQSALCTYKDPDLPVDSRLDRALEILRDVEDLSQTRDQETLGLAGAIYKRKWEVDSQTAQLERALNYYQRGYEQGVANDQGYTGINAAFVLDLIAYQEEEEAKNAKVVSEIAAQRRKQAKAIRKEIVEKVAPLVDQDWLQGQWWFYSTVAEAYFGMGNYDAAIDWLRRGRDYAVVRHAAIPAWEYESTARQLAALARLDDNAENAAGYPGKSETEKALDALKKFFGEHEIQSAYAGKVGLALSGGGFRASLFHIGVLARLAELDVLRRVEVLSCVSGGSIIGAHYYLEVRRLLQSKPDDEITRQDYIDIVARVRKDFLDGVQRNIRTRVAANPFRTVKMIFTSKYSRTMRGGELYESEIFSRVKDGGEGAPRWLNGLYVCPLGRDGKPDDGFNFKTDNWTRRAKVPNLILNATALNTGHNWQFTASWMGEPAAGIDGEIDGNDRLRRLYYDGEDTPKTHRQVRLGHAVAASACVPGVFEPLPLDKLYPERIVRLVDGGVCDNQGTASLLEQDCNVILVSDGSGQMGSEGHPSNGLLGVPLRSNSILQSRVREAQYRELSARKRASLLRGFMFVHLKEDLDVDPIDWIGCLDPHDASDDSRPAYRRGPLTRYGIAKDMQELLAAVRTDLDSFSDVEAFALMTSGYRMTEHEFRFSRCVEGISEPQGQYDWDFLAVEEGMKGSGAKYEYLTKQLSVSNKLAFKIWKLSKWLKVTSWMLAAAAIAFAVWACFHWASTVVVRPITLWGIGVFIASTVASALLAYVIGKKLMRVVRFRETLIRVAIGLGVTLLGWLAAGIHLMFFDRWFLRQGSLKRFKRQ
jgi:predicted acylesterase/phospholipase RssA